MASMTAPFSLKTGTPSLRVRRKRASVVGACNAGLGQNLRPFVSASILERRDVLKILSAAPFLCDPRSKRGAPSGSPPSTWRRSSVAGSRCAASRLGDG
jgi:hypothetical protein